MRTLPAAVRARLVDDWREASRWWSVRINAVGVVLLPLLQMVPEMPAPIQALLPPGARAIVAGLWCVVAIGARLFAQKRKG